RCRFHCMRFRTNSSPPPHLDRKLQRRMLGYVALIAVGMFVFQVLFAEKRRPYVVQNVLPADPGDHPFQVREEPITLDADEFRMPLSQSSLDEADGQSPDLPNSSDGYVIDPFYLRAVKDNTLNVRREESDAFFYVLDRARQLPLEAF